MNSTILGKCFHLYLKIIPYDVWLKLLTIRALFITMFVTVLLLVKKKIYRKKSKSDKAILKILKKCRKFYSALAM